MTGVLLGGSEPDTTGQLEQAGIDLIQHTESNFFVEEDPDLALPRQLPRALKIRDAVRSSPASEVRHDLEDVFAAYAADHRRSR